MSRRIVTPVNQDAFDKARQAYLERHPNPQPEPGTPEHRKRRAVWLQLYKRNGGKVTDKGFVKNEPLGRTVEPCPLKNVIRSVAFLSGNDEVNADAVQRVNLPSDRVDLAGALHVHRDRLGISLRVKVSFLRNKKEAFKVALLAHNANPVYDGDELRADAYKSAALTPAALDHAGDGYDHYVGAVYTGRTKSDGTAVIEGKLKIPPSGGAKYKLVAWDVNGNVVFSGAVIETKRTLFYATFLADDPAQARAEQGWFRTQLEAAYVPFGIELMHVGEEAIPGIKYHDIDIKDVLGNAVNEASAQRRCRLGCTYVDLSPYIIRMALVDHVAGSIQNPMLPVRFEGVSPDDVVVAPCYRQSAEGRQKDPNVDWRKALWVGLGPTHYDTRRPPNQHDWFCSASLTSHGDNGDVTRALDVTDLTLVGRAGAPDAKVEVQVRIPSDFPANRAVTFNLTALYMNTAKSGETLKEGFTGITVQPSRQMFKAIDSRKQLSSAIHEVGHAIGMVVDTAVQKIKHPEWYFEGGNHCWHGVNGAPASTARAYHQIPYKDTGTCVMYGLIPDHGPNMDFCAHCQAALRKLDMSAGYMG